MNHQTSEKRIKNLKKKIDVSLKQYFRLKSHWINFQKQVKIAIVFDVWKKFDGFTRICQAQTLTFGDYIGPKKITEISSLSSVSILWKKELNLTLKADETSSQGAVGLS